MSHPACGRAALPEPERCRLPSGRCIFARIHTPRFGGVTRELDVWPRTCLASLGPDILGPCARPDKISHLLHFRGGLWCPVTFATVCCCSFETVKNGELCQTTQNFKPHQLQLGMPGESCLYLSPLSSHASQLTGVVKITGTFYPSHSSSSPLKILDCSGSQAQSGFHPAGGSEGHLPGPSLNNESPLCGRKLDGGEPAVRGTVERFGSVRGVKGRIEIWTHEEKGAIYPGQSGVPRSYRTQCFFSKLKDFALFPQRRRQSQCAEIAGLPSPALGFETPRQVRAKIASLQVFLCKLRFSVLF